MTKKEQQRYDDLVFTMQWVIQRIGEEQDAAIIRHLAGKGPRPDWRGAANESIEEIMGALSRNDLPFKPSKR